MSEMPALYREATDTPVFVAGQVLANESHTCTNREAVLLFLCHSKPTYADQLLSLSTSDWRKLLHWTDVSGLTLYFADQVNKLNLHNSLPSAVYERLKENLSDNRIRMRRLFRECAGLLTEFQRANISVAVLKGFSLLPSSVPVSELRHQLDLDFLVEENGALKARQILEQAGYRLYDASGRTWEFKKDETPRFSNKSMYKDVFGRTVELHIESSAESLLNRREYREIEGVIMPVLAPANLFLRQGMHVFKDVCSSFARASHLLEFYRHVRARADDCDFWSEVREQVADDPRTVFGLGIVFQLIGSVVDGEIPSKLASWTMLRLPAPPKRWVLLYGKTCLYGTPPGTKLYLLLQRELERAGMSFGRPVRAALLPTRLPKMVVPTGSNDTLTFSLQRYALQARFVLLRLRFHVVEGLRYAWASYLWRRNRRVFSA